MGRIHSKYGALADSLRRGYAAASTDTGHTGTDASFAVGHPEKLIDFGTGPCTKRRCRGRPQ